MPSWTKVRVAGVPAPYAPGFGRELRSCGYTDLSTAEQLRLMSHLSRWMSREGLEALSCEQIAAYCADRKAGGYVARLTPGSLGRLQAFLQAQGVLSVPPPAGHPGRCRRPCHCAAVLPAVPPRRGSGRGARCAGGPRRGEPERMRRAPGAAASDGGEAAGELRPADPARAPGLRDADVAGAPGAARWRGRVGVPGRHRLAGRRADRARQGWPG